MASRPDEGPTAGPGVFGVAHGVEKSAGFRCTIILASQRRTHAAVATPIASLGFVAERRFFCARNPRGDVRTGLAHDGRVGGSYPPAVARTHEPGCTEPEGREKPPHGVYDDLSATRGDGG